MKSSQDSIQRNNLIVLFLCDFCLIAIRLFLGIYAEYSPALAEPLWSIFIWTIHENEPKGFGKSVAYSASLASCAAAIAFLVFSHIMKTGSGLPAPDLPFTYLTILFGVIIFRDMLSILWVNTFPRYAGQIRRRRRYHSLSYLLFAGIAYSQLAAGGSRLFGILPCLALSVYLSVRGIWGVYRILLKRLFDGSVSLT